MDVLAALCAVTGIPVGETQAGKGSLLHTSPQLMGAVGSTWATAANALARDMGVIIGVHDRDGLTGAIKEAKAAPAHGGPVVIHVETDPTVYGPDSQSWWDVPISQVSALETTQVAYEGYRAHKAPQRALITPSEGADRP